VLLLVLLPLLVLGGARGAAMRKDTGPFRVHDRVLVAYTDKYYEAKVRQRQLLASIYLQDSNCFSGRERQHTVWYVQIPFAPRHTNCETQCTLRPLRTRPWLAGHEGGEARRRLVLHAALHGASADRRARPPLVASTEAPCQKAPPAAALCGTRLEQRAQ